MATALTATPQPSSTPPSVLLNVTGAPSPPATAYTSNFSAGLDSWATSGTGNTLTQDTGTNPVIGRLRLLGNPGPATATRTVTGLTVSAPYRLRMSYYTSAGQMRPGVSGMTAAPWVSGGSPGFGGSPTKYVTVDYLFTATATSHVITVDAQKATSGTASVYFHTVTVTNVSTWQGTTITRTDTNGTAVPVRNPTALDTVGGVMTLTDYENALVGTLTYTVTDGAGATATTTIGGTVNRTNLVPNPSFETNLTGWNAGNGATLTRIADTEQGAWAVQVAPANTAFGGLFTNNAAAGFPVVGGASYAARARFRAGTIGRSVQLDLYWYKSGGTASATPTTTVATGTDATGIYTTVGGVVTAPADAVTAAVYPRINATAIGEAHFVDAVMVTQTATLGAYFDGDTAATTSLTYGWTGGAHASASAEYSIAIPSPGPAPSLTLPVSGPPPSYATLTALTDYGEAAESQGTVHVILGRTDKLSNPGVLLNRTGTLELICLDYDDATAVRNLLRAATVALLRQGNYLGMDLYFIARGISIAPAEITASQRWVCTVAYDEVPRP